MSFHDQYDKDQMAQALHWAKPLLAATTPCQSPRQSTDASFIDSSVFGSPSRPGDYEISEAYIGGLSSRSTAESFHDVLFNEEALTEHTPPCPASGTPLNYTVDGPVARSKFKWTLSYNMRFDNKSFTERMPYPSTKGKSYNHDMSGPEAQFQWSSEHEDDFTGCTSPAWTGGFGPAVTFQRSTKRISTQSEDMQFENKAFSGSGASPPCTLYPNYLQSILATDQTDINSLGEIMRTTPFNPVYHANGEIGEQRAPSWQMQGYAHEVLPPVSPNGKTAWPMRPHHELQEHYPHRASHGSGSSFEDNNDTPWSAIWKDGEARVATDVEHTTLMVQNIPRRMTRQDFLDALQSDFAGLYDYCYVPRSFHTSSNKGYAFVNFVTAEAATAFKNTWHLSYMLGGDSLPRQKPLRVASATLQGRDSNLRLASSKKMTRIRSTTCRPLVL